MLWRQMLDRTLNLTVSPCIGQVCLLCFCFVAFTCGVCAACAFALCVFLINSVFLCVCHTIQLSTMRLLKVKVFPLIFRFVCKQMDPGSGLETLQQLKHQRRTFVCPAVYSVKIARSKPHLKGISMKWTHV